MMNNDTIILAGRVKDTTDENRRGTFKVQVGGKESKQFYTVNYVSPYGSNTEGAFIAIPEPETEVLICSPHGSSGWYYMGTTFAPEQKDTQGGAIPDSEVSPIERAEPHLYRATGRPMKYSFTSPHGGGITMSEEQNDEFINRKVEIASTVNKRITLNDSPEIDSITIDSGNGSKITLGNDPQSFITGPDARSVQIESTGPQKYLNSESGTDIVIENGGKELNLINNAHGLLWGPLVDAGNINLQSKYKDVNIFSKGFMGNIFLQCLNPLGVNQKIILETRGSLGGEIILKTNGTIKLQAGTAIEMVAPVIKTNAATQTFTGATFDVAAAGPVNIDGAVVNLAGGFASPATVFPTPDLFTNSKYGFLGLTAYDFIPFPLIPVP